MKDLLITLVLVYGISYQRIYKPPKMYMSLKTRWHGCTNVIMRNMCDVK